MYQYTKINFVKRGAYYDVIVYYSKNGEKFRPPTGVKVSTKHLNTDKEGNQSISSKHPRLDEDMEKIREVRDKVENLIVQYKDKYGEKPPVPWLEAAFEKPALAAKKDLNDAMCYWDEFIKEKQGVVRGERTIDIYNNLKFAIRQFKEKKNLNLTFDNLDQQFFNDFLHYLIKEHEFVRNFNHKNKDAGIIPAVGVTNETAIKRLKDFAEYLNFCSVEYDVNIKSEKIKKYIKAAKHKYEVKPLSSTQKWELTLTPEEIEFTVNLKHHAPEYWNSLTANQKRYLAIIIFMCLQGTAPIDTKEITRQDIRNGIIIKERSKSGNDFMVELDPISLEILEMYDYNLNFIDQTLNDQLKKLFVTVFEYYRLYHEAKYKEPYDLIAVQKSKKGDEDVYLIQHKGLFMENMTGRRSFITNLAEKAGELGLKNAMDMAGHTKIETPVGYIHSRQRMKKSTGGLFGIKKLGEGNN